jgi:hypothetical protein
MYGTSGYCTCCIVDTHRRMHNTKLQAVSTAGGEVRRCRYSTEQTPTPVPGVAAGALARP